MTREARNDKRGRRDDKGIAVSYLRLLFSLLLLMQACLAGEEGHFLMSLMPRHNAQLTNQNIPFQSCFHNISYRLT